MVRSSFAENGRLISVEKRKIHFMNVITEYLPIIGLKMPRYSEKQSEFATISRTPTGVVCMVVDVAVTLLIIRYKIPHRLNTTPPTFFAEIGSLRVNAAMNIV
jgi:hypothetical protein